MKMDTMNISLTSCQAEYVRRAVNRDFGNASEFFRELLRRQMAREIAEDMAFLKTTTKGAEAGPSPEDIEDILRIQREVRKKLA
jgi:Arc/MetJ-type ribon-helix-helix transcriptional regulator